MTRWIDESGCSEIIGTIAGDDTILVVIKDGVGRNDVTRALVRIMPKLENRLFYVVIQILGALFFDYYFLYFLNILLSDYYL